MSVLVITGTNTGVGRTVATAALACHARVNGHDVAVCKPVQTGTADGDDDLAEVGTGIRSAKDAAALYDQDVEKQAKQLGLPNW